MTAPDSLAESDVKFLAGIGVRDPKYQRIVIANLPCGIKTVRKALEDETPWQINAPRAILVCVWKGMVSGFQKAEADNA